MEADLHVHALPASRDAFDAVDAIAKACAAVDVRALALTDHGPGCDYAAAHRILDEQGIRLIPGRELNTPLGHVLTLATDTEWLASLPEAATLPLSTRDVRGPVAFVWAHPYGWRVAGATIDPQPARGAEHLHAVEVLNGERLYQAGGVAQAAAMARTLGLGSTGGSDAHRAVAAGRCVTVVDGADTVEGFIEGIRAGVSRARLSPGWAAANGLEYARPDLAEYR